MRRGEDMLLQRRGRRGATLVEFALSWTIFFFITVVGIMDLGRGIWAYNALAHMAHEATRFAIVRGADSINPATTTDIETYVETRAPFLGPDLTVTTNYFDPAGNPTTLNDPGNVVEIRINYNFRSLMALLIPKQIGLTASSRMVISN